MFIINLFIKIIKKFIYLVENDIWKENFTGSENNRTKILELAYLTVGYIIKILALEIIVKHNVLGSPSKVLIHFFRKTY